MSKTTKEEHEKYGLTKKQYDFANLYLKTNNVIDSYTQVYNTNGSRTTASSQAYKVLKSPRVQIYIQEMQRLAYEKDRDTNQNILSAEEIMVWWSDVIRSTSRSIKMADKIRCSENLAKAHGMFTEKISADINSTNDIVINITNDNDGDE